MEKTHILKEGSSYFGLELNEKQIQQFLDYYEMLIEWNEVMNLTAITEFDEVMLKHFVDSMALGKAIKAEETGKTAGQAFWESFGHTLTGDKPILGQLLSNSVEKSKKDAEDSGSSLWEYFAIGFYKKSPIDSSKSMQTLLESLFGSPTELGERAAEAGRTVGDQFTLEVAKSMLKMLNNPVMKFLYEKTSGRSLTKDIEAVNKALKIGKTVEKTSNSRSVVGSKGRGHADTSVNLPTVSLNANTSASEAEKQGKAFATSYAKGIQSGKSAVQTSGNNLFRAGLNGSNDNGNGGTKFYNTSASEAQKYAQGLTSANSNSKSAGKGLYNNAYKGVTESNSGTKSFKYVSFEQAKQYSSNLSSKTAKTNAYNAGISLGGQAATGAGSKKGSFTTAGQNAGAGFVLGIDKNKSKATTSGMTIAMNALKKLKEVLGIHSPSKAFGEAGMYSVLGYANAITDNTFKATNAVALMSDRVLATAKTDLTGVLANPLARGNVSMPSSGVGYGIGMSNDTAMASLASQVYQAVVSGMEVVADSLENRDIKVLINGKEVFKAVQTEQRKSGVAISNGAFSTT